MWPRRNATIACLLLALGGTLVGFNASAQWRDWRREVQRPERDIFPSNNFTFCRLEYTSGGWGRRGGGKWATDWPESDVNFSIRLAELTTINVNFEADGEPKTAIVKPTDPELYNYPFVYMLEVGDIELSDEDCRCIREYLLRGGFIMVDDFWGRDEWIPWEYAFNQIFPPDTYPYRMVKLPLDHPIYNMVFPIKEVPQVPSINNWMNNHVTYERYDAKEPEFFGVTDEKGRLMMIVCHNTDLGDGWEREGENHEYFEEFSVKKAYPMGINIVVYAMTH